jgi:hypothetical protein
MRESQIVFVKVVIGTSLGCSRRRDEDYEASADLGVVDPELSNQPHLVKALHCTLQHCTFFFRHTLF